MTSPIRIETLAAILREAAKTEIMPRFRRLAAADIREKTSAIDLVTEADEAAERFIKAECARAFPDAVFVGEESVAEDPALLGAVGSSEVAIVVDPIDGTANFAAGAPIFGVMAAVVRGNETVAGLIYDPLGDDVMLAEKGAGAFLSRAGEAAVPLRVAAPTAISEMIGAASVSQFELEDRRRMMSRFANARIVANYRCAAHEYRLAASGHFSFLFYQKLMPWDHLAGALIVTEAGGYVRRWDGSPYLPSHVEGGLMIAPDAESWQALHATLFD